MDSSDFEWDEAKNLLNQKKHGVSFEKAQGAFFDLSRVIVRDLDHETRAERRYFCLGKVAGAIMTVRFTYRQKRIRIYGAGYWRKGKKRYEQENT
jgi:uncharacterized protein